MVHLGNLDMVASRVSRFVITKSRFKVLRRVTLIPITTITALHLSTDRRLIVEESVVHIGFVDDGEANKGPSACLGTCAGAYPVILHFHGVLGYG